MKLPLALLEKLIELPSAEPQEVRHLLDDLGLEVKNVEGEGRAAVFTIETLANRGDHRAALGMARELSARLLTPLKIPSVSADLGARKASLPVRNATEKCLRYALLELALPSGMQLRSDVAALLADPSPERHAIVHLLNYVQLELGQPMHAFDRDKVDGEVVVDLTQREEEIEALDGAVYRIPTDSIVIRDRRRIIAVAGVIGCANTMVTPDTTRVLVESAIFDPVSVRLTARAMGLSTEASQAFERGCDPENVLLALKRLAYLIGAAGGAVQDRDSAHTLGLALLEGKPIERRRVSFPLSMLRRQLNLPRLADVEVTSRLKYLGFAIEVTTPEKQPQERQFTATVPSWRLWDIRNPEDMVEEFGRVHGLNQVRIELPPLDYTAPPRTETEQLLTRIEPALIGHGFFEVITKGFYSQEEVNLLAELDPHLRERHICLKNAIDTAWSHMKVTNVVHLARLAAQNLRRGVLSVKVYEFGRLFSLPGLSGEPYEFEREMLTMAAAGRWHEHEWRKPESREAMLLLFKGAIEALFGALRCDISIVKSEQPLLHPGCQGGVRVGRSECGFFGLIHPGIAEQLGLTEDCLYAEFEATKLLKALRAAEVVQPSDFPAVRRDITLKVGERELAGRVVKLVEDAQPANLAGVRIVDAFRKPEESFRRITYRLTFQSGERTLAHEEVDQAMSAVLGELKGRGIELA